VQAILEKEVLLRHGANHMRNQWNNAKNVMSDSAQKTISCEVTLSGHFFAVSSI
jgi:hypothetical protein